MKRRLVFGLCIFSLVVAPAFNAAFARGNHYNCTQASTDESLTISADEPYVVSETTFLSSLTIAEGATIAAPDGYSVTLTVDCVETPIEAGMYTGNVVLTVTEQINVTYGELDPVNWRTAIYVEDGQVIPEKSVAAAVAGGEVTDSYAQNVKITSVGENFNGIVVTGDSTYAINNPRINFTGNGGNDFSGYGAGITSKGTSEVTVDRARIITEGAIRTAVFVGEESTMNVNNSTIEVRNGTLPEDYEFNVEMGKMMEVPWMLGLTGNCRATNLVGSGTANYTNSRIKAQAWGALSTDDTVSVRLNVKNCNVEAVESGYGAYSIGDSIDTFDGCKINVADMALIIANGSASGVFTNGTKVKSGRFGVMMHSNESGTLTIDGGSIFVTEEAVIQVKSSNPTIYVDDSLLYPKNGIILQAIVNDDPFMTSMGIPGSGSNVDATFSNMSMNGDIINGNTSAADVTVAFENAIITGAITTAETEHVLGPNGEEITMDYPELYYLVGSVTHTYGALGSDYGMSVTEPTR